MMAMRTAGFLLTVLLLSAIAHAADETEYINRGSAFSIQHPADWERKENLSGAAVAVTSPGEGDAFRSSVTVIVHDIPKTADLRQFSDAQYSGLEKALEGFARDEKSEIEIGALKAVRIVFHFKKKETKVKCLSVLIIANERGYIVTCSADESKFDAFKKVFDDLIASFKVL